MNNHTSPRKGRIGLLTRLNLRQLNHMLIAQAVLLAECYRLEEMVKLFPISQSDNAEFRNLTHMPNSFVFYLYPYYIMQNWFCQYKSKNTFRCYTSKTKIAMMQSHLLSGCQEVCHVPFGHNQRHTLSGEVRGTLRSIPLDNNILSHFF
jgi:hypothetical protein